MAWVWLMAKVVLGSPSDVSWGARGMLRIVWIYVAAAVGALLLLATPAVAQDGS